MSKFVDYTKRDLSLPDGCKDLIDVLRPSKKKDTVSLRVPVVKKDCYPAAGLAEIKGYLTRMTESRAEMFVVVVRTLDEQIAVGISHCSSEKFLSITPYVNPYANADWAEATQNFFSEHHIQPTYYGSVPHLDTSGATLGLVYSLPIDAPLVSELIVQLLRGVYGLDDQAGLQFQYCEY